MHQLFYFQISIHFQLTTYEQTTFQSITDGVGNGLFGVIFFNYDIAKAQSMREEVVH